jgi:hypothetical protein
MRIDPQRQTNIVLFKPTIFQGNDYTQQNEFHLLRTITQYKSTDLRVSSNMTPNLATEHLSSAYVNPAPSKADPPGRYDC